MRLSAAFAAASMTAEERPGLETPPGLRFGATAQLWAGHAGAASDRRLAVVLVVYRFTSRFSGVGPREPGFIVISPPARGPAGRSRNHMTRSLYRDPTKIVLGGEIT